MDLATPVIDQDRLWADHMALAAITDPERPYTRRSFSQLFLDGRAWLRRRFEEAGMSVRLDAAANMIARLEGTEPGAKPLVLGSHSDSVPSGGRFDGMSGLLTALEAVRALKAAGITTRAPLEIVDFLSEELSEFGLSCVGSRATAGVLDAAKLAYKNAAGETLGEAIGRMGGDPSKLASARRDDIAAYLELHIEQGVRLESSATDIGLVTAIAGIMRFEVIFEGEAGHAGTTAMSDRRDASLGAAELVLWTSATARAFAARGPGHFVATAGVIDIKPNAATIVPGEARLIIEFRAETDAPLDEFVALLGRETLAIAARTNLTRTRFVQLSKNDPAACDRGLLAMLERGATAHGLSTMQLASGAGHDAGFVSRVAPSAMIFIPCRGGRSHTPEEWSEADQLAKGAATLMETIRIFDGRNS